jgi:UDPglucose 6-dehydrogenase
MMMKLSVVGAGYVGLVTAVCLAKLGHRVTAVDRESVIQQISKGSLPIWEPGLEAMLSEAKEEGTLTITASLSDAAAEADALMIAVGTPARSDGTADLSQIHEVQDLILPLYITRNF